MPPQADPLPGEAPDKWFSIPPFQYRNGMAIKVMKTTITKTSQQTITNKRLGRAMQNMKLKLTMVLTVILIFSSALMILGCAEEGSEDMTPPDAIQSSWPLPNQTNANGIMKCIPKRQ